MYVISSVGNRNAVSHVPKHVVWFNDWGWMGIPVILLQPFCP